MRFALLARTRQHGSSDTGTGAVPWRTALHLSVDLTHSQRGMFLGIVLLVATIMSLVLFFALGKADGYQRSAHLLVSYVEGGLHVAVLLAVALAALSMRRLGVDHGGCSGRSARRIEGRLPAAPACVAPVVWPIVDLAG